MTFPGNDPEGPSTAGGTQTPISQTPVSATQLVALPALTSAQVAAAPTQADFNALQTDVAAIHASLASVLASPRVSADEGASSITSEPTYSGGSDTAGSDTGPSV